MRLGQWIIVLILTGIYALASAEFYRYVDEKGEVHYTDDLANVPVEQRPKVDEYGEPYDEFGPEEAIERKKQETEGPEGALKEDEEVRLQREATVEEGEKMPLKQKLKETGTKLEEEYQTLMKEREELEKAAESRLPPAERTKLLQKVSNLNARIEDYEKRREVFNKEVEAYNAGIKKGVQESR